MFRYSVRLLALSVLQCVFLAAQPVDEAVLAALKSELKQKQVPGGVVGVLDGGRVMRVAAAGLAITGTAEQVTTDMLFRRSPPTDFSA